MATAAQGSTVNMLAGPHPEIREGLSGLLFLHTGERINSRKTTLQPVNHWILHFYHYVLQFEYSGQKKNTDLAFCFGKK